MTFLPVKPQSPTGPPMTKRPAGLIRYFVSSFVNFFNNNKVFRNFLEKFGVHRNAKLPKFVSKTAKQLNLTNQSNTSKFKVAIFTTCYHNFNEPGVIKDFYDILKHNEE